MKVLQIINSLSSGGAEVFVAQLSVALSKYCDVKLMTYAGELDVKGENIREYLLNKEISYHSLNVQSYLQRLIVPFKFASELSEWKPDIIHVHLTRSEQFVFLSSFLSSHKFKVVRTKHSEKSYPPSILNSQLNKFFDLNIACSDMAYVPFKHMGLADNSVVIKNGIEINRKNLLSNSERKQMRTELILPRDKNILINIGSMHPNGAGLQKAQDVIINALCTNNLADKCHFIFLGGGAAMASLRDQARNFGIEKNISFKGIVSNVDDYISCVDLMVMPSRWEGLPIAAIEVACSGLPMVLSDIDSFKEFNTKSVIKCRPDSAKSLELSISKALESLDYLQNEAAVSAKIYQHIFSIENAAKEHIEQYENILS